MLRCENLGRRLTAANDESNVAAMPNIIVRRRLAEAAGTVTEVVVFAVGDRTDPEPRLRRTLQTAQDERGQGRWSDADPEVWIGNSLIGRLPPGGDIEALVQQTIGQLRAQAASLPRLLLNMASVNGLPEDGVRKSTGVYLLFRRAQPGDPPQSVADGYTCLLVAPTRDQTLGPALEVAVNGAPRTGATHFSIVVTNLDFLTNDEHRRLYAGFQPVIGEPPTGA